MGLDKYIHDHLQRPVHLQEDWDYLDAIAKEYHVRTEAYDRTVCTGPVVRGAIMPMVGTNQFALINKHALQVLSELKDRALRERGLSHHAVNVAIRHYRS